MQGSVDWVDTTILVHWGGNMYKNCPLEHLPCALFAAMFNAWTVL